MTLKYYGMSCFHLRHGDTRLVTDPFDPKEVGIPLPAMKADIVLHTQSLRKVSTKAKRKVAVSDSRKQNDHDLYVIAETGEYEVGGIFVRMLRNPGVVIITVNDVNICYLGLAKDVSKDVKFDELGNIHYLIVPVGDGEQFMEWKRIEELIKEIEPHVVIPSCYLVDGMKDSYKELKPVKEFSKQLGFGDVTPEKKLKLQPAASSEEAQYKLVTLEMSKS